MHSRVPELLGGRRLNDRSAEGLHNGGHEDVGSRPRLDNFVQPEELVQQRQRGLALRPHQLLLPEGEDAFYGSLFSETLHLQIDQYWMNK